MSKAKAGGTNMEKLKQLATGLNHRFPEGDDAFQIPPGYWKSVGHAMEVKNDLAKNLQVISNVIGRLK